MRTLGATNGDIDFTVVDGLESLRQRVEQGLRFHKAEWFLNTNLGVPYFADVLGYPLDLDVVRQVISAHILRHEEVTAVTVEDVRFNAATRRLTFRARVSSIYGDLTMETVT